MISLVKAATKDELESLKITLSTKSDAIENLEKTANDAEYVAMEANRKLSVAEEQCIRLQEELVGIITIILFVYKSVGLKL